jgi:tripartite-type tricarboxylate transporter receptor subunit TctC
LINTNLKFNPNLSHKNKSSFELIQMNLSNTIHNIHRRKIIALAALLGVGDAWSGDDASPISLLVGYSPGGLADTTARLVAQELSLALHRPVVVKNLPGASGLRAINELLQAQKDPDKLMLLDTSSLIAHESATSDQADIAQALPVGIVGKTPFALAVSSQSRIENLAGLLAFGRQHPQKINYGSPGVNSVHHMAVHVLLMKSQVQGQHIAYQGGVQMLSDLFTQKIDLGVMSISLAEQYVRTGQLRVLAVTGEQRSPLLPSVPTLSETHQGLIAYSTGYLFAAPQTNAALYRQLIRAWQASLNKPDWVSRLNNLSLERPSANTLETTRSFLYEKQLARSMKPPALTHGH